MERVDRTVADDGWRRLHPIAHVYHLLRYRLDRNLIVLKCDGGLSDGSDINRPPRFRLEHMWLRHPDFREVVKSGWADTHMGENLMEQLHICGEGLMKWAKAKYGSVKKKKKELYERLKVL